MYSAPLFILNWSLVRYLRDAMVNILSIQPGSEFHGKDHRELYQFSFRQHWIRLAGPFFKMVLKTTLLFIGGWIAFVYAGVSDASSRHGLLLTLLALFTLTQWGFLLRFYQYFLYVIIVTDKRVHRVKRTLISTNDHETIDIWSLQDIDKSQHGFVQNLFGYGTLILESQNTKMRLHFIPRIAEIHRKISSIREAAREHQVHRLPYE